MYLLVLRIESTRQHRTNRDYPRLKMQDVHGRSLLKMHLLPTAQASLTSTVGEETHEAARPPASCFSRLQSGWQVLTPYP